MQRLKDTGGVPAPHPVGNWLAVGSMIATLATQTMVLGCQHADQRCHMEERSKLPDAADWR
jgi:hypothetical protein